MKIEKVFIKHLEFCKTYRKPGTYLAYQKSFKLLSRAFTDLKIKRTGQLKNRYDDIITWLLNNTEKKNCKINSLITDFATALRFCNIDIDFKMHKLTDDTSHYKSLNDEELDLVVSYLRALDLNQSNNLVNVTAVMLMLDGGLRKSEVLNVENKNINFIDRSIWLDETKTTKRMARFGELSAPLVKRCYSPSNKFLLINQLKGGKLTRRSLERFLDKLNKCLNIKSGTVHPHRLRKTFATQLLKEGCPLTTIQILLGHADITTTMIYLDIDIKMLNKDYHKYYPYH